MKKLRVGFDIDGVLLASDQFMLDGLSNVLGRRVQKSEIIDYDFTKAFEITMDQEQSIIDDAIMRLQMPSMPGVEHIIELLDNFEKPIPIITSRPEKYCRPYTIIQLVKIFGLNLGDYYWDDGDDYEIIHSLYLNTKSDAICQYGLDYFVEDASHHAIDIADNSDCTVLLVDQPWNQNCRHERIIRCGDWKKENQLFEACEIFKDAIYIPHPTSNALFRIQSEELEIIKSDRPGWCCECADTTYDLVFNSIEKEWDYLCEKCQDYILGIDSEY